jgi:hypothetical protein
MSGKYTVYVVSYFCPSPDELHYEPSELPESPQYLVQVAPSVPNRRQRERRVGVLCIVDVTRAVQPPGAVQPECLNPCFRTIHAVILSVAPLKLQVLRISSPISSTSRHCFQIPEVFDRAKSVSAVLVKSARNGFSSLGTLLPHQTHSERARMIRDFKLTS